MADSSDAGAEASSRSEDLAKFLKLLKSLSGIKSLLPKFTMEGAKHLSDLYSRLEPSCSSGQGRVSRALFKALELEASANGVVQKGETKTQYEKDLEKLRDLENISLTALFSRLRELVDNIVETFEPEVSNLAGSGPTRTEALVLLEAGGIITGEEAFGFLKHPESFLPIVPEELLSQWRERNPAQERSRRPAAKRRRADSQIEDFVRSQAEGKVEKKKKDNSEVVRPKNGDGSSSNSDWDKNKSSQWGDWNNDWYKKEE